MRPRRFFLPLLITIAFWTAWSPAAISAPLMIEAQQQIQYAQQLFDEGQFRRAAEEFERFAFFFPNDPQRRAAIFNAGRCYLQASDGLLALQRLNALTEHDEMDPLDVEARFLTAECYLAMSNAHQAVVRLHDLITRAIDPAIKDRAYARIGWILIGQLDWNGAQEAFGHLSTAGREHHGIDAIEERLTQADRIPHKSPTLAGALSIVPGVGQLYCGRYQDAAAALIVNGGLFWAAYESFDHDLNALGGLLTIVGLGFYTANIYGAVSSAHKYNLGQQKGFAEQLKHSVRIHIGPSGSSRSRPKIDAVAMSLYFQF
jgi:tetratricopeptide (TPR) repeat protein